jgi:hypothetical protein
LEAIIWPVYVEFRDAAFRLRFSPSNADRKREVVIPFWVLDLVVRWRSVDFVSPGQSEYGQWLDKDDIE